MGLQRQKGRAAHLPLAAALGATLLAAGGTTVRAQGTEAPDRAGRNGESALRNTRVTLELVDAQLPNAVNVIRQRSGIDIVFKANADKPYNRVTVSLHDKPVDEALKLVADSAGAAMWLENGIYFIGPKSDAPKQQDVEPILPPQNDFVSAPGPTRWEKIYLKFAAVRGIKHALTITGSPTDDPGETFYMNSVKMMMDGQSLMTRPTTLNTGQASNGTTYVPMQIAPSAPVSDNGGRQAGSQLPTTPSVLGSGTPADQGAHRSTEEVQEFGRGGQRGGFGGAGGGFGGQGGGFGGAGGGQAGGFGGQGGGGGQAGQAGSATGLLPPGISPADIYAFDADNSIIVRYTDEVALRQLRDVIALLDVKPRQLLIRAEFVTVSRNDAEAFGINYNFTKVNLIAGANLGYSTANTTFIQYATGNLLTQISLSLTQGRGKVVSSPIATTLNNVPVTFTNTQQVPVFLPGGVAVNGGAVVNTTQLTLFPVTVGIQVLPRINGDESITMFGQVVASDITGTVTGPNGESAPIVVQQTVPIQRIIRNGETMVIGGLTRKNDNYSTSKIPLLGDLPLIGTMFRSRQVTTSDSELLVFVTPEILPERAGNGPAAGGAGGNALPSGAGGTTTGGGGLPGGAGGGLQP